MASLNVSCPRCGAKSGQGGFGAEPNRVSVAYPKNHSSDSAVTKRRERARAIRVKNSTAHAL